MGLFSKKKKQEPIPMPSQIPQMPDFDEDSSPELPEFPEFSEEENNDSHYQPTIADIKNEITRDDEQEFEVPIRETPRTPGVFAKQQAAQMQTRQVPDKPIFVKIDKYKDVLHNVDMLKVKIADAEELLNNIEDVRSQEEEKLEQWKKDIQSIKEKLLSIDEELFEV